MPSWLGAIDIGPERLKRIFQRDPRLAGERRLALVQRARAA